MRYDRLDYRAGAYHIDLGVWIIEDANLTETVEDWSRVRSPSRAARRARQGHRQNIITRTVPRKEAITFDNGKTLVMHPAIADQIRKEIKAKMDRAIERAVWFGTESPSPIRFSGIDRRPRASLRSAVSAALQK